MSEIINKEMQEIKQMIIQTVAKRDSLKNEMQEWYDRFPNVKFKRLQDLITTDNLLSQLDSHYKRLWDFHNTGSQSA
jgi:uncharacterized protein